MKVSLSDHELHFFTLFTAALKARKTMHDSWIMLRCILRKELFQATCTKLWTDLMMKINPQLSTILQRLQIPFLII